LLYRKALHERKITKLFLKNTKASSADWKLTDARKVIRNDKEDILNLTHSRYAVPLLDGLFDQPIFTSTRLQSRAGMPSLPMIMNMLGKLKKAGIIMVLREGRGSRSQILALADLLNICEGKKLL
jgi:hypothetical protein